MAKLGETRNFLLKEEHNTTTTSLIRVDGVATVIIRCEKVVVDPEGMVQMESDLLELEFVSEFGFLERHNCMSCQKLTN
ncbi:hypothetical protein DYB30_009802 [Aphanomyces astaci]|uniref:Uncharacterized protein n=1 Tax=Aphanomyces astaci TaxID=112090 RepID=A0A397CYI6_APHAT|nr:hypothetical protein DYB34_004716 [Aphanomyces astaci]RHY54490.1 hypothetical protein DYB30_009802 [Aphanomyces astaci]